MNDDADAAAAADQRQRGDDFHPDRVHGCGDGGGDDECWRDDRSTSSSIMTSLGDPITSILLEHFRGAIVPMYSD